MERNLARIVLNCASHGHALGRCRVLLPPDVVMRPWKPERPVLKTDRARRQTTRDTMTLVGVDFQIVVSSSAAENELSCLLGGLLLHVREDVGVRVERDGDIRMTEALTYDLGRDAS